MEERWFEMGLLLGLIVGALVVLVSYPKERERQKDREETMKRLRKGELHESLAVEIFKRERKKRNIGIIAILLDLFAWISPGIVSGLDIQFYMTSEALAITLIIVFLITLIGCFLIFINSLFSYSYINAFCEGYPELSLSLNNSNHGKKSE